MIRRRHLLPLAALPSLAAAQPAWPTRPIRLVVPFPPGGSNDVLGRALADRLGAALGQPLVVENRAGAGGSIGADVVAKSAPDGYTLLFISSSLTTNVATQRLPYDPVADFTPVAQAAVAPMIVTVGRDHPSRDLATLIRLAREQPGRLRYGGAGPGDTSAFAAVLMTMAANVEMEGVAYRGIVDAQNDTAAGRIDVTVTTLASARALIEGGQLRVLAVAAAQRDPRLAEVPTAREAGLDYVTGVWWGVFAPARLPEALRTRLNGAINAAMPEAAYQRVLEASGAAMAAMTADAFAAHVRAEAERWATVARRAGVAIN
jgi:tripartite-type tricarboxylate transporter receptor subunit TctC